MIKAPMNHRQHSILTNHLPSALATFLCLTLIRAGSEVKAGSPGPATPTLPSASWLAGVATDGLTYYVRPDGGSRDQCTGLVNAPYPGNGTARPCAWDHPFRALPPGESPYLAGGDTLILSAGSYQMGVGAPGAEQCDESGSFDCHMPPIPSGPDPDHRTRILGQGWDGGCHHPVELWGSGRPWFIVNLTDSSNVELACLEITDHSGCVEFHSGGLACNRDDPPYGDWASTGLYAEDSAKVLLRDLNIHGLASAGIHAGRLTDWTVSRVRLAGNGWVGWDGDLWDEGGDANTGTLTFSHWTVEWNGCGESYPQERPVGCWGQTAGGYGDGVGVGMTGGDWIIEDSSFLHNTSDGLDLLYHTLGGDIILNRVRAEGNAGNQIKVTGQTRITNGLLVGNCAFFEGAPFTYEVDHCRALGSTLVTVFTGGEQVMLLHSSLYGQGDGLIGAGPHDGFTCNGQEAVVARNSIFLGDQDYFDPSDRTFLFYQEDCGSLRLDSDHNVIHEAKNITCGLDDIHTLSGDFDRCEDPLLIGPLSGERYGMMPVSESPAIDSAKDAICLAAPVSAVDQLGQERPQDGDGDGMANCDRGALEHTAVVCDTDPLTLDTVTLLPGEHLFASEQSISTLGSVRLVAGAQVSLRAPAVRLRPGFSAARDARLEIWAGVLSCVPNGPVTAVVGQNGGGIGAVRGLVAGRLHADSRTRSRTARNRGALYLDGRALSGVEDNRKYNRRIPARTVPPCPG